MVGHQWLPWINNPASGSISAASTKQEQETSSECLPARKKLSCHHFCPVVGLSTLCLLLLGACVALSVLYNNESDGRPQWRSLLFDYQNISDGYLALSEANNELRGENELLTEHNAWLDEQARLLNGTSAKLMSLNLALSLESTELMEQIVSLTSTNLQLSREHERLVQLTSDQEEERRNMTQAIKHLADSNALREQEEARLSEENGFLRDEMFQVREKNRELLETNEKFRREVKNLSERIGDCEAASKHSQQLQRRVTELQEQTGNLSSMLMKERQEAAEREDNTQSTKDACSSLDLYCPVVNHKTRERVCRKCPDSWRLFGNKCYYFSSRLLTWSSSRAWCRTQGGDLLVVDSEAEQSFIFESSQAADQKDSRLWIGLTDAEEEGEWIWVDGRSVDPDVQFWLSRTGTGTEPDDWKQDDPLGEDCGHIDTTENTLTSWMDGSCKKSYRWICEKNL